MINPNVSYLSMSSLCFHGVKLRVLVCLSRCLRFSFFTFLSLSLSPSLSLCLSLSLPFCCSEGATALHWAATTGHVSVMKELLKLKARQLQLDSASVGLNRETQDFTFPNLPWWSSVPQIIGTPNQEEGRRHHNLWAVLHE